MIYKNQSLVILLASYKLNIVDMPAADHGNSDIEFSKASNSARDVVKLAEAVTRNAVDSLIFISNLPKHLIESICSTKRGGFCLCNEIIDTFNAMGQALQKTVKLLDAVTVAAGKHLTSSATNFLLRIRQIIRLQVQGTEEMANLLDTLQERLSDPNPIADGAPHEFIRGIEISLSRIIAKIHPAAKAGDQMVIEAMTVSCEFLSQMGQQLQNQADGSFGLTT